MDIFGDYNPDVSQGDGGGGSGAVGDSNGVSFSQILQGLNAVGGIVNTGVDTYKKFSGGATGSGIPHSGSAPSPSTAGAASAGSSDTVLLVVIAIVALMAIA